MTLTKPLQELLSLDCPDLGVELIGYVTRKLNTGQPLLPIEEEVYLVGLMLAVIEMEGFVDLFHQFYSWRQCTVVEEALRKLDLHKLADLFVEAKYIFTRGQRNLTIEEYHAIDIDDGDERWQRFDAIGDEILANESEIYLIGERICGYLKANLSAFPYALSE